MSGYKRRMLKLLVLVPALSLVLLSLQKHVGADNSIQSALDANPLQPSKENLALGLNHFDAHCATCHGSFGKADTNKGKSVSAADLTSLDVQSKSDKQLYEIIAKGVPGTAMPGFGKTHSRTEIWQTVLFLRKLPTLRAEEREKLEAAMPPEARHHHGAAHEHPMEEDHHEEVQPEPHHEHQPQATAPQPSQQEHHHGAQPPAQQADHDMSKMGHQHSQQPSDTKQETPGHDMSKMGGEHAGHDMGIMPGTHDMHAMISTIIGGPFETMEAVSSGTSLLPATSPMYMWHWMNGG